MLSGASSTVLKHNGTRIAANASRRRCFVDVASDATLPLKGIKVLDMTRVLAGVGFRFILRFLSIHADEKHSRTAHRY